MTFKYIGSKHNLRLRASDRIATPTDIAELNTFLGVIKNTAKFYQKNMSDCLIDYVYNENQELKILAVKYMKSNFPHLTGINFGNIPAQKQFENLLNGKNEDPIIIERQNRTIRKLEVLNKLPEILQTSTTTLTSLKEVEQAQRIGFSKALKNEDKDLLLALQNFQPEFYTPKSLLNIRRISKYQNVPADTILGIFRESNNNIEIADEETNLGRSASAIAINHNYVKTPKDAMEIANLVANKITSKDQNVHNELQAKANEEAKKREQYKQYLAQQGLNR